MSDLSILSHHHHCVLRKIHPKKVWEFMTSLQKDLSDRNVLGRRTDHIQRRRSFVRIEVSSPSLSGALLASQPFIYFRRSDNTTELLASK